MFKPKRTWPTKVRNLFSSEIIGGIRFWRTWWLTTFWSVVVIFLLAGAIGIGILVEQRICNTFGDRTGYEVEFIPFAGCYAQTEGGVFHKDQIRFNEGN